MELTIATIAALAKTLETMAKDARDELAPGEYAVATKVTLDVQGTVRVSDDELYTPTTSVPVKAALALFMRYSGCTGPAAMAALVRAMTEAVAMGEKGAKTIPEVADLEAAEERVLAGLAKLPAKSRRGKVCVKAAVQVVETVASTTATESGEVKVA